MPKPKKHILWKVAVSLAMSLFVSICSPRLSCFAEDKIVAIVNKDVITQKDLDDFTKFMRMQYQTDSGDRDSPEKARSMKDDLLEKLIEDRLILQEAKRSEVKVDASRIKGRLSELRRNYGSEAEFQDALAKQGLVLSDLESRIREQSMMYFIIELKVRNKIAVKPTEVTEFYQKNLKDFELPEERGFDAMPIDDAQLAGRIFDDFKKGQRLEDLAKANDLSLNKVDATRGGQLKKEIEDIVFKMDPGEVSGPVKIENKYYIFRLNKINPPRQQVLAEVRDKISVFLFNQKMQEGLSRFLDELKKKSYIKTF